MNIFSTTYLQIIEFLYKIYRNWVYMCEHKPKQNILKVCTVDNSKILLRSLIECFQQKL